MSQQLLNDTVTPITVPFQNLSNITTVVPLEERAPILPSIRPAVINVESINQLINEINSLINEDEYNSASILIPRLIDRVNVLKRNFGSSYFKKIKPKPGEYSVTTTLKDISNLLSQIALLEQWVREHPESHRPCGATLPEPEPEPLPYQVGVLVYTGSDTMDDPAYFITDESHSNVDNHYFADLHQQPRWNPAIVNTQLLLPIFNVSFQPRTLTFFNGNDHMNHSVISITNRDHINTIRTSLREALDINDDFYLNNSWFEIIFPDNTLSSITLAVPMSRDTAELRTLPTLAERQIAVLGQAQNATQSIRRQIAPYTSAEVDNYRLNGTVRFPQSRFINTEPKLHDNCLLNELINLYSRLSNHCIAESTIRKYFNNGETATIGRLKQFCDKYEISYTLFNIFEDAIYHKIYKSKHRLALVLIIHEHHVSRYVGDLRISVDFSKTTEHTISGYKDTRKSLKFKPVPELTTIGLGNQGHPNFSFLYEENLKIRSLMWQDPTVSGKHTVHDMNDAYYSAIMSLHPDEAIPKFQITDEIREFVPGEVLKPFNFYYLRDISDKVRANQGLNAFGGQLTNYMYGYRLIYEINMDRLAEEDITYVRVATEFVKASKLQNIIKEHDPKKYKIINGLFGQARASSKSISLNVSIDDLRLLMRHYPELIIHEDASVRDSSEHVSFSITKTLSQGKYRYLNNFDFHNYTIEICNFIITKKVDEMMKVNSSSRRPDGATLRFSDIKLTKVWVDCIGFNIDIMSEGCIHTGPIPSTGATITFKEQKSNYCGHIIPFKYKDPKQFIEASHQELQSFFDGCVVITGPPGCGKTYYVKHNLKYDYAASFQNKCARMINGETIHKTFILADMKNFYKHCRKFKDKTIWIDEISQVQSWIWSVFFTVHKLYGTKFILTGDFDQIPPYGEDPDYDDYFWSNLRAKAVPPPPNEHQRCDRELLNLATKILHNPTFEIPPHLLRTVFNPNIDHHFSLTKNCRTVANEKVLNARRLSFDPPSIGVQIVAIRTNVSKGYSTGSVYTVTDCIDDIQDFLDKKELYIEPKDTPITLRCIFPEEYDITINRALYSKDFVPGYGQTIHSSQGATIDKSIAIYEIDKIRKKPNGNRILYTALTRVKRINQLNLYKDVPNGFNVPPTIIEYNIPTSYLPSHRDDLEPFIPHDPTSILHNNQNKNINGMEF